MNRQKAHGVYYTPQPIVRYIVERTLDPLLAEMEEREQGSLAVLDPACGDGAFLVEAYRYLLERELPGAASSTELSRAGRERILKQHIYGVDIDGAAIRMAKKRLAGIAAGPRVSTTEIAKSLDGNLHCGDALLGPDAPRPSFRLQTGGDTRPIDWHQQFAPAFHRQDVAFDAVIGNPPYVNIRVLSRSRGTAVKQYLRDRYRCARGGYDLYVLFLEKALELLRPGGRCGMIVPNKLATLDYAQPCRSLLLEQATLLEIVDVSDMKAFPDAGVYPYILIWEKRKAARSHHLSISRAMTSQQLSSPIKTLSVAQSDLSADDGFPLESRLDVESRVATLPLGQCVELHSGTTGFVAQEMARSLLEREDAPDRDCFEFIVSGNIDRYRVRRGDVRFMKRDYRHPVLPTDARLLSSKKRRLFSGPKIVLAGMIRRLEAAWDAGGLSLGVQVYAAAEPRDPWFLLGLLNSKLFSFLFRLRFPAKRLAGGYLAVNKGQLARLPVRVVDQHDATDLRHHRLIVAGVRRMHSLHIKQASATSPQEQARLRKGVDKADRRIDTLVYQLYRLSREEKDRIEASFVNTTDVQHVSTSPPS